jgi:hypothetical protein
MSLLEASIGSSTPASYAPRTHQRGPAPFTPQPRIAHYNLNLIGLARLIKEEEQLAYRASIEGLTAAGQHRLDAIAKELDCRWKILG